jgi:hypothetical protein
MTDETTPQDGKAMSPASAGSHGPAAAAAAWARALAVALVFVGCGPSRDSSTYLVTVGRPDGSPYKTFELQSDSEPRVASSGGCLQVWSSLGGDVYRTDAYPAGWLVEVAKQEETE